MERLKEVISAIARKGGCGKTTTIITLAGAMLREDKNLRILVVDLDSQGNASTLLGWNYKSGMKTLFEALRDNSSLPVYDTSYKPRNGKGGVFITPYHPLLASIDIELSRRMQPKAVLRKCFAKPIDVHTDVDLSNDITEAFDYILIDCPPALGDITFNAMSVSDSIIIPVQSERCAIDGLVAALDAFYEFKEEMKPDLELRGILFTMLDERTKATKTLMDVVRKEFSDMVMSIKIRRCTKVIEAQAIGDNLYDYAPHCTTAFDYSRLASRIINDNK